jgi:hypothetical protein
MSAIIADITLFNWDDLSSSSEWEVEYESDNDESYDSEEDVELEEAAEDNDKAYDIEFLQLLGQV